jgi:hypothetical protein
MYKYGERNNHSYLLGVRFKKQAAIDLAKKEEETRGFTKYKAEIAECDSDGEVLRYLPDYTI